MANTVQSPRRTAGSALAVVLILLFADAQPAFAEDSASDRATARALAAEGYAALEKKDYATAEDRFRRADELVHAPTLVLDLARALLGLGRLGEAYAAYDSVMREALPPNAPPVWKRAVRDAAVEIEAVKLKVAWLTVQVKGASAPQVEINGHALAPQRLGERLPQTPGELHVVVSAPDRVTRSVEQRLREGEEKKLEISLIPLPKPTPEVVVVAVPPSAYSERAPEDRGKSRCTLAYVSFAVSGVGVAVGATTGILWLNARHDITSACGGLDCQPQNETEAARFADDKRRYDTFGTLSVVGFAVGLAGAATGTTLLLTQPKEAEGGPARRASIQAYVGPGMVWIRGAFQ